MRTFLITSKTVVLVTIAILAVTHRVFGVNRGEIHSGDTKTDVSISSAGQTDTWEFNDANRYTFMTQMEYLRTILPLGATSCLVSFCTLDYTQ